MILGFRALRALGFRALRAGFNASGFRGLGLLLLGRSVSKALGVLVFLGFLRGF